MLAIMEMGKEDGRYVNPKTFTSDLFFLSFPLCLAATYDENLFLRVTILLLFSFLLVGWQGFVIQTNEKEE